MNTEKIYESTLDKLVKSFEEGLKNSENIDSDEIFNATQSIMPTIKSLPFVDEYKEALGDACINAGELLDDTFSDKKDLVEAFKQNLDEELAHLHSRGLFNRL